MSTNCIKCGANNRTGLDLLCDECRPRPIDHFLKLAQRGRPGTGASGGEVRARKLALAILEFACGLDENALRGAGEFIHQVAHSPNRSRDMLGAIAEEEVPS